MCRVLEEIQKYRMIEKVDDLVDHYEVVVSVLRAHVALIASSKGWDIADFHGNYDSACDMTLKTLSKGNLRAIKSFYGESTLCEAIRWLINRLVSNLRNISFDPRYRAYSPRWQSVVDRYEAVSEDLDMAVMIDKLYRLDKSILIRGLRQVLEDSSEDIDFDLIDFQELCEKFGFTVDEVIKDTLLMKVEQTAGGRRQLVLMF